MIAASEFAESLAGARRVLGWYHSHPQITVPPSRVDTATQATYQTMDQDYHTMDKQSTFRPPSQNIQYSSNTQDQTLPLSRSNNQQPLPPLPQHTETIPSVPGYAKPFAHQNGTMNSQRGTAHRPFHPPPEPPNNQQRPQSAFLPNRSFQNNDQPLETSLDDPPPPPQTQQGGRPLSSQAARLLETSLDNENLSQSQRAKSIGALLETNLDDENTEGPMLAKQTNGHSRSLSGSGLLHAGHLSFGTSLLESDL